VPDSQEIRVSRSSTGRPANVRLGVPGDEKAILAMLLEGHDENGLVEADVDKMRGEIAAMVRQDSGAFSMIGLIEQDGQLAASVGLTLSQLWYSSEWTLGERWAYVRPAFRDHTDYVTDLINFSKWASDQLGVPLEMGIISTFRTEAKVRLYRRHLKPIGAFFAYGIERANGPLALEERLNHG
jgi:hypothetical protein